MKSTIAICRTALRRINARNSQGAITKQKLERVLKKSIRAGGETAVSVPTRFFDYFISMPQATTFTLMFGICNLIGGSGCHRSRQETQIFACSQNGYEILIKQIDKFPNRDSLAFQINFGQEIIVRPTYLGAYFEPIAFERLTGKSKDIIAIIESSRRDRVVIVFDSNSRTSWPPSAGLDEDIDARKRLEEFIREDFGIGVTLGELSWTPKE